MVRGVTPTLLLPVIVHAALNRGQQSVSVLAVIPACVPLRGDPVRIVQRMNLESVGIRCIIRGSAPAGCRGHTLSSAWTVRQTLCAGCVTSNGIARSAVLSNNL